MSDVERTTSSRTQASYPLASLALLATVFAAALACTDADRWNQQYAWLSLDWPWRLVGLLGGAGLFGGLVGIVQLFFSGARGKARWVAPLAGVLAGQVGALILVAPGPMWRTLCAVTVLLGATMMFRIGAE